MYKKFVANAKSYSTIKVGKPQVETVDQPEVLFRPVVVDDEPMVMEHVDFNQLAGPGQGELCLRCAKGEAPDAVVEQLKRLTEENRLLKEQVVNLKEDLETQRGQTKAYREYINIRAEKDLEMTGGAVATDWKKRLDEYIAHVSIVIKVITVLVYEFVLTLKPLQT